MDLDSRSEACSSAPGARTKRCRRLSDKKAEEDFSRWREEQEATDRKEQFAEIIHALKEDDELFATVRSVVRKHQNKKNKESKLRKGVRDLGSVPAYVLIPLMSRLMKCEESFCANLPLQDVKSLRYYALKGESGFCLPRKEMTVQELHQWAAARYQSVGSRLEGLDTTGDWIDWEEEVGVFQAVVPQGATADALVTHIRDRETGETKRLATPIPIEALSETIRFQDNYSWKTAKIFNSITEASQPIKKLWEDDDAGTHSTPVKKRRVQVSKDAPLQVPSAADVAAGTQRVQGKETAEKQPSDVPTPPEAQDASTEEMLALLCKDDPVQSSAHVDERKTGKGHAEQPAVAATVGKQPPAPPSPLAEDDLAFMPS